MLLPPFEIFPELHSATVRLRELKTAEIGEMLEILTYDGEKVKDLEEGKRVCAK